MANSIFEWLLTIFPIRHFITESSRCNSVGLAEITVKCMDSARRENTQLLSPEEEIIIQMAKEYPLLFIAL